jgi:hypothetical protein
LPKGQLRQAQIFSARYLERVPENIMNGAAALLIFISVIIKDEKFMCKVMN